MSGNYDIKGGGVGRLMERTILNFHFDYLHTSLRCFQDVCKSLFHLCRNLTRGEAKHEENLESDLAMAVGEDEGGEERIEQGEQEQEGGCPDRQVEFSPFLV